MLNADHLVHICTKDFNIQFTVSLTITPQYIQLVQLIFNKMAKLINIFTFCNIFLCTIWMLGLHSFSYHSYHKSIKILWIAAFSCNQWFKNNILWMNISNEWHNYAHHNRCLFSCHTKHVKNLYSVLITNFK